MTCPRRDKKGNVCGGELVRALPHIAGLRCASCNTLQMGSARPCVTRVLFPLTQGERCSHCRRGPMVLAGDWLVCESGCGSRQLAALDDGVEK